MTGAKRGLEATGAAEAPAAKQPRATPAAGPLSSDFPLAAGPLGSHDELEGPDFFELVSFLQTGPGAECIFDPYFFPPGAAPDAIATLSVLPAGAPTAAPSYPPALPLSNGSPLKLPTKSIKAHPPGLGGTFTSIFRGVTRHRATGKFEAHFWDASFKRDTPVGII